MAPAAPTESEENPYEPLGVSQEATDAEIRTAYHTRSLKVHPDRVRPSRPAVFQLFSHTVSCRIEMTLMHVSGLVFIQKFLIHVHDTLDTAKVSLAH